MELKFVDIDDYRKQVKHLFVTAFPREERPPMWMLTRRCRQGKGEVSCGCGLGQICRTDICDR